MEMSNGPSCELRRTSLCFIRMCCLNPFSVVATYSHWSHFGFLATTGLSLEVRASCCFFARNSSLLLAFLRRVEGLAIFFVPWLVTALLLVSREKEKSGPMEMEKLKCWPWLTSAWQNAMHLEAKEVSSSAILNLLLKYECFGLAVKHAATSHES